MIPDLPRPRCGHPYCAPQFCRFAGTSPVLFDMQQGDRRDAHQFNLLAIAAPKLSARGRIALYSGIYSKDH